MACEPRLKTIVRTGLQPSTRAKAAASPRHKPPGSGESSSASKNPLLSTTAKTCARSEAITSHPMSGDPPDELCELGFWGGCMPEEIIRQQGVWQVENFGEDGFLSCRSMRIFVP